MDETPITRDSPSNYTIDSVGSKRVLIKSSGSEKESYTVVLAVSLQGEKLPASLIFKGKGTRNSKLHPPDNLYLLYDENKSWMNKNLMLKWLDTILMKRKRKIELGKKGLLILDNMSAHVNEDVKKRA